MRGLFLICLICLIAPGSVRAADVIVFAAASLAGPLDQVAEAWEADTGHTVTRVYAGSSAIARQVEAGAPADVVFLASTDWMDHLVGAEAVQSATVRDILGNRLALIINTQVYEAMDLTAVPERYEGRLAVALSESVPAGIYARAALEASGVWEDYAGRIVEADNVRAATRLVAIGAVERGMVYVTEAYADPRVTILGEVPERFHPPIRYPAALATGAGAQASEFLAYLQGHAARFIFRDAGFQAIRE